MNNDYAKLSTDLRRVSNWIYHGNFKLSKKMIKIAQNKYKIDDRVGCFENIWDEIKKIKLVVGGRLKAAERALTLSSMLLQKSYKKSLLT